MVVKDIGCNEIPFHMIGYNEIPFHMIGYNEIPFHMMLLFISCLIIWYRSYCQGQSIITKDIFKDF